MPRRAAVYARISRDRAGAHLGVDRQLEDCRDLAQRLGWDVVTERTDNDLSAYSGKTRPGYQAILDDLRTGRADAVLAWHPDRLHRRPVELEEFINACETHGVAVQTVQAGEVDLGTASGRAVARTLGAWARHEVEHSIERQKRAKLQAATAGRYRGGRRPFGYDADGVTVRESEAATLRELAARTLAGESMKSLARDLNARGITGTRGAPWTGAAVHHVLIRPRNAGRIEHLGEDIGPAVWPAVLPEATWRAVRDMLNDPGRVRVTSTARKWLGSGLYRCGLDGCGLPVRIGGSRHGDSQNRRYYRCSGAATHVTRSATHVDDLVTDVLLGRLARPDAVDLIRDEDDREDPVELHTEANGLRVRLDALAGLYADGTVDAHQLAEGTRRMRATLADVEQRLAATAAGTVFDGLVGVADVAAVWAGLSLDRRRAVLDTLLAVTILPGKRGRPAGWAPGEPYFSGASVRIEWKRQT